ncbi:hypothetical protein NC653_021707 [Populus alba x Populus x berolinensis]|uniref:Uncharacterized protein n=1 Tax=Populus alba x Populus x berolinensis TaxID=444605 RepID=A0AAD6QE89_9ROSI|nr:hypothetical protein NC653_021707 [Populus alba x Populus x berolinensis]
MQVPFGAWESLYWSCMETIFHFSQLGRNPLIGWSLYW